MSECECEAWRCELIGIKKEWVIKYLSIDVNQLFYFLLLILQAATLSGQVKEYIIFHIIPINCFSVTSEIPSGVLPVRRSSSG